MSEKPKNYRFHQEIEKEIFIDEIMLKRKYLLKNSSTINITNNNTHSNILLNSIQDFLNKYELGERKKLLNKQFLISFQELITLLYEAILSQQKIDRFINMDITSDLIINEIKNINQKFIDNLTFLIFSLQENHINLELNSKNSKNQKCINISSNTSIIYPNDQSTNQKNKLQVNNNPKKNSDKKSIYENLYKEVFANAKKPSSYLQNTDVSKISNNNTTQRNKTPLINKSNLSSFVIKVSKDSDITKKKIRGKSAKTSTRKHKIKIHKFNSFSSIKKNFPKQEKKSKKKIKSKKIQKFDIYSACENMNIIRNSKNPKYLSRSTYYNNDNKENESYLNKSQKSLGTQHRYRNRKNKNEIEYGEMIFPGGVKKIIVSTVHKPSNFANKLLISGHKYINDFKEMNEVSKKKYLSNV